MARKNNGEFDWLRSINLDPRTMVELPIMKKPKLVRFRNSVSIILMKLPEASQK